jgi:hypothetical protein
LQELENQRADVLMEGLTRVKECRAKQTGIQKMLVRFAGPSAVSRLKFLMVISSVTLNPKRKPSGTCPQTR